MIRPHAIPMLPVLSSRTRFRGREPRPPSILDVGSPLLLDRGASAIELALRHAGVGKGDEVLVPAFHCPSMVWPISRTMATPVFYRIGADLRVTPAMIEERLTARTTAVLVPHFFGQLQDMSALRALADERRLVLIEDCAHAFFGSESGLPIGSVGHYAIASPRKFFPLAEGGVLTSGCRSIACLDVQRSLVGRSARIAYDVADAAVRHGRFHALASVVGLVRRAGRLVRGGRTEVGAERPPAERAPPGEQPRKAAVLTRMMLSNMSLSYVRDARWRNYTALRDEFRSAPGVELIDGRLPPDAAPYMVPILLRRPDAQFPRLKSSGIPVWRWEHSVRGICGVTDRFAESLVQIPCHQELGRQELDAITAAVRGL